MKKDKLVIIVPHLSTGGMPQFVLKKIEVLKDIYDIFCIEYNYISSDYVIQRNKIGNILMDNFYSIQKDILDFKTIIKCLNPDIIWVEEIGETFIDIQELDYIYNNDRKWKILESTHTSDDLSTKKKYMPDKFMFVSEWSINQYKKFNIDYSVIQYPIDIKERNQELYKSKLSFDKKYKHILCVGLFTPSKNQGYIIDIANYLKDEEVIFHFVGNMASNFSNYWKPLLDILPSNCILHGEKENVDEYIQACDLFIFPSKYELNPLVIKEALCYKDLPILMFNLHTYCNIYNDIENIHFLSNDIEEDSLKVKYYI